ncbi:MAG: hypothetical protein IKS65_09245 [Bacteroidales bacterium]|nr:hypothetical protein [Bacteroidales bacterium]
MAQVFIFDNIRFGNYIHPYVYMLFVMLLPFETPKWRLILDGFLMGMSIDIFSGTPGLNAAATVFMAYVRPYVINAMTRKSDIEDKTEPSVTEMGVNWFFVYGLLLLILHNLVLFWLEAFSIKLLGIVLLEVLLSAPISLIVIILIIYIFKPIKK